LSFLQKFRPKTIKSVKKFATKFHCLKTSSGKVVAQSTNQLFEMAVLERFSNFFETSDVDTIRWAVADRMISTFWPGVIPFP